ncbi:MAG: YggS family pyridoxal phosphate-dependent enzyme [Spirochaetes bacterium]|nr:YggS family pyridoxal phosphate-dependent enzyme [Spirochaetota bacterium]
MDTSLKQTISDNLARLEERIQSACLKAGRPRESVRLLAVSKFNPAAAVQAAWDAGQRLFGENRVQEAAEKFPLACGASELHLLGHLQSNKAKKAVQLFNCVQSVDSLSIMQELARQAEKIGKTLDILLELHTGEESKSGFADETELFQACETALDLSSLRVRGLMTMAPFTDDAAAIAKSFVACRSTMEKAAGRFAIPDFSVLSMGMTNDFELAIAEGATLLRIGTAIFGARQP